MDKLIEERKKALSEAESAYEDIADALPLVRGRLDAILPIIIPIIKKAVEAKWEAKITQTIKDDADRCAEYLKQAMQEVAEEIKSTEADRIVSIICDLDGAGAIPWASETRLGLNAKQRRMITDAIYPEWFGTPSGEGG